MLRAEKIDISNLSFVYANLTSSQNWDQAMKDIDYVLHLASPLGGYNTDNPDLIPIAIQGINNVFKAAIRNHVKKIIRGR